MLEEYLQAQGREWERFAWLKSRVVAPRASVTSGRALALRVAGHRRSSIAAISTTASSRACASCTCKVRDEAQRRAAGRPERANDVKLSRGGIREIEFIVQLLLVVRGGQFPEIRTRSTLKALDKLAAGGLMKRATAERLADAYALLRRVEHRIQYLDDQQTHVLPTDDGDLDWIAASLGHSTRWRHLRAARPARRRARVRRPRVRQAAARRPPREQQQRLPHLRPGAAAGRQPTAFLAAAAGRAARRACAPLCEQPKIRLLRDESKMRLGAPGRARGRRRSADGRCTPAAALRFVDWLEPLLRRESYLALLAERPEVQNRLLRLLGLARWPMRYLMLHPGVIDELADERLLHDRFDADAYTRELEERHAGWERSGQAEEELAARHPAPRPPRRGVPHAGARRRRPHHGRAGRRRPLGAGRRDARVRAALGLAAPEDRAPRPSRSFAVIAYGKLGGKELGYGSDLDVVFVYDDPETDPDKAAEVYGAFVRKLITWLTMRTAAGELFDIDTALRPNGNSGLLVTSMTSFENYQTGRGSNTAWTWEHQALTRARWCAGIERLAPRFEAVRRAVLAAPRDLRALLDRGARDAREGARRASGQGRPLRRQAQRRRHDGRRVRGAGARARPRRARTPSCSTTSATSRCCGAPKTAGLLPAGVGSAAADAYRDLRRAQHRARLDEQPTQVDPGSLAAQSSAVLALWRAVFG